MQFTNGDMPRANFFVVASFSLTENPTEWTAGFKAVDGGKGHRQRRRRRRRLQDLTSLSFDLFSLRPLSFYTNKHIHSQNNPYKILLLQLGTTNIIYELLLLYVFGV